MQSAVTMLERRLVRGFERAVLLALSLPAVACGGKSESVDPHDGGVVDSGPGPLQPDLPDSGPDGSPCVWTSTQSLQCSWTFELTTGTPLDCAGFAGAGTPEQCASLCGQNSAGESADSCSIQPNAVHGDSLLACIVDTAACQGRGIGGRRPEYFASLGFGAPAPGREVGAHFARAACMEAGSVDAFRILRDELRAHGAPPRLVRAASKAMRDEARHTRQSAALARRYGAQPIPAPRRPATPARDLATIARENALEGCVRETFSALECLWQSHAASDPVIRATMARIARDEMKHMALSWAVHRWAMGRLSPAARAHVRDAQQKEVAALKRELAHDPAVSLRDRAGLPRARQAITLIRAIEERLAA
jgi:hypothetical protein